jgi:hypothetical protein
VRGPGFNLLPPPHPKEKREGKKRGGAFPKNEKSLIKRKQNKTEKCHTTRLGV